MPPVDAVAYIGDVLETLKVPRSLRRNQNQQDGLITIQFEGWTPGLESPDKFPAETQKPFVPSYVFGAITGLRRWQRLGESNTVPAGTAVYKTAPG